MTAPIVPRALVVRGDLPDVDPANAQEDDLDLLDEDMLQLVDATGTFTLDVGWYPAGSRDGRFILRAISSSDWRDPLEEVETRDRAKVLPWLNAWIEEIKARLGQPDRISEQWVVTQMVVSEVKSPSPASRATDPSKSPPEVSISSSSSSARLTKLPYAA